MTRDVKYIGLDVHKEAITIAVRNGSGKLAMESIIETKAATLLQFLEGLRGELHVTLEEGTWATWLYDVVKPKVYELVVCNPRRNALLKEGSKSDRIDARKLSELLRAGMLRAVYHGENGLRTLKELARSYETISKDVTRVMNRLKAIYRGWGIGCTGTAVYDPRHRQEWLDKIPHVGVRLRAKLFYEQLDGLRILRKKVRGELLTRHSPRLKISSADAWSRVVSKPQVVHLCSLCQSFLGTGFPHGHCCDVPRGSTFTNQRPALSALYASFPMNADHAASCTDLASLVFAKPFMFRSSTAMMPL